MPIPFFFHVIEHGPPAWIRDNATIVLSTTLTVTAIALLKLYTSGRTNTAERKLHSKVMILTGGTSGIGSRVAYELAARGAQLVLLTSAPPSDPFLADYIQDLRNKTNNEMIYAEQVDLSSLHSIRKFATKWIDNAPPRRLDALVLCAATMTPPGGKRKEVDGVEETWLVNYLANFHLLGILSPAIRAQPFDRDVRIIMTTCSSYIASPSLKEAISTDNWSPGKAYSRSKMALNIFGQAFQKHLSAYKRPDQLPMNARVISVDPGLCRTPGTRRWLTRGSLFGLVLYLVFYPIAWLLLKSQYKGAQSILYALMEPSLSRGEGGNLIKECMEVDFARPEVKDEKIAKKLWEESDALIERVEKAQARARASELKEEQEKEKDSKDKEKQAEVESLVDAIKKGREQEKQRKQKQKGQNKSKNQRTTKDSS